MNTSISSADLARWIGPSGIDLSQERLTELANVVTEMSRNINGYELDAVRAAHGAPSDGARVWAAAQLGDAAPTVNPEDATDLLERLLAAAVIGKLDSSQSGIRCALAIASADFLGFTPLVADLGPRAAEALARVGRQVRERPAIEGAVAATALGSLPKARKLNEETGEGVDATDLADDVAVHARALRAVAAAVDRALGGLVGRQESLDEEVEMLWWTLRATDDSGTPFSKLDPAVRAVRAGQELARRTENLPGPPSASYLLGHVLGSDALAETTLAELAGAISGSAHDAGNTGSEPLLALTSAAAEQKRLGADNNDETWHKVVDRTLGVDVSASTTLVAGAQQVYRECLLERSLKTDE